MKKLLAVFILLCALFSILPAHAQTNLFANASSGVCVGYKPPCVTIGGRVEHRLTRHIELQGDAQWTPTDKTSGGSGNSYRVGATVIYWISPKFGLTANVRHSWLRSQSFNKNDTRELFGVVTSFVWLDAEQKFYVSWFIPSGRYDPKTGIESNRMIGPAFRWEVRMTDHIDMFVHLNAFRVLSQGNPQCDGTFAGPVTCPRSSDITGDSQVGISYRWGR